MEGQIKSCFGLINLSREDSVRPACQLMIFPHSIPLCSLIYSDKEKLINLIERALKRECSPYLACNERQSFFTSGDTRRYKTSGDRNQYKLWSCQNVYEGLIYLLDNIYIRFGTKLYRQIVGTPIGTNYAPLVSDLFLFC